MNSRQVLIISHDVVGARLAGPGIRYQELARVLAEHYHVFLAVPGSAEQDGLPFEVWPYQRKQWHSLAPIAVRAEVVVACGDTLFDFPALAELPAPLVVDGYDPHTLETLALWAEKPVPMQIVKHDERLGILKRQCLLGDFFICASERQRDWWLGALEAHGRINPHIYAADPSLRHLVDVVPFGLPAKPPQATRPVLRGVWPGLDREDRIVLWGGGLWEWLDPLTAVRAMRHLVDLGLADRIRLVFPGTRHPGPDAIEMPVRMRTLALADELQLTGQHVFFGDWIPHEDWPALLREADVGLSLHPDAVEARLAYRSRVLDYVWAGLPMAVTQGDVLSEVVRNHGLGLVVGFGDEIAVAEAILRLLEPPETPWQDRFARAQAEMTWERAAQPLVDFCRNPRRTSDRHTEVQPPQVESRQALAQALDECNAEAARLRALVASYENGRFMRLMRHVHEWREKTGL